MSDTKGSIYALVDPLTNKIRYIGKTTNKLSYRLNNHIFQARKKGPKNLKNAWIKSILNKGLKPIIIPIQTCIPNLYLLNDLEKFYIQFFKDSGFDLKNQQPGGDGQPKGFKFKKRFVPKKGTKHKNLTSKGLTWRKTPKQIENYKKSRLARGGWDNSHSNKKILARKGKFARIFNSLTDATKLLNISIASISNALNGKSKTAKGFTFKFYNENKNGK